MIQGLGFWGIKFPVVDYIFALNVAPQIDNYMKIIDGSITYLDTTNQPSSTGTIIMPPSNTNLVGVSRDATFTTSLHLLIKDVTTNTTIHDLMLTGGVRGGTWGFTTIVGHKYLVQVEIN